MHDFDSVNATGWSLMAFIDVPSSLSSSLGRLTVCWRRFKHCCRLMQLTESVARAMFDDVVKSVLEQLDDALSGVVSGVRSVTACSLTILQLDAEGSSAACDDSHDIFTWKLLALAGADTCSVEALL